jgi:hypothetical protein
VTREYFLLSSLTLSLSLYLPLHSPLSFHPNSFLLRRPSPSLSHSLPLTHIHIYMSAPLTR